MPLGKAIANTGYVTVLRSPGVPRWTLILVSQRLPVAAAPLALVFAGRQAGSFALGGLLVGVHSLSEAAAAPWLGQRLGRRSGRHELPVAFGVEAVAFGALAFGLHHFPFVALAALTGVGGAAGAGAPGGLRAMLTTLVVPDKQHAALSLESAVSDLVWAAAPVMAAGLATTVGAAWPLAVMSLSAAVAAAGSANLPMQSAAAATQSSISTLIRQVWPAMLISGAVMLAVGTNDVLLAPRLAQAGLPPVLAGPLLAGFVVAGLVGGLGYGARRWPGLYAAQSRAALLAVCVSLAIVAVLPRLWAIAAGLVIAGLAQAPCLIARNLALRSQLRAGDLAAGYSAAYAAAGIGYGTAGLLAGVLQPLIGPALSLLAGLGLAMLSIPCAIFGDARASTHRA